MRKTKEFILISGVPCKIQNLTGLHERLLTTQKKSSKDVYIEILADCILELGDITDVSEKHIKRMLDGDKKHALIELRQFSNNYDPRFNFTYEFPMENNKREKHEYSVDFSYAIMVEASEAKNDAPEEDEDGKMKAINFKGKPYFKKWSTYGEINEDKIVTIRLEDSKELVQFSLLDGELSELFGVKDETLINSHTYIKMRKPQMVRTDEKKTVSLISVNLDTLSFLDINQLRAEMVRCEGTVDTTMVIAHPTNKSKEARVDLLRLTSFFFPSLAL